MDKMKLLYKLSDLLSYTTQETEPRLNMDPADS